jgi:peptide/nickel transport system substrate-binding protein
MARARWALLALIMTSVGFATGAATAEDLRIGLHTEPTSLDPHFHNLTPNDSALSHIYERLVMPDDKGELHPALAESWSRLDDKTWRFKLRPNVLWHDGTAFTADDVVFSFERAPTVPGSPSSYASAVKGRAVSKIDALTIDIVTASPDPLLLNNLARVMIVSRKSGAAAKTEDYNSGKAAIGTGPYKVAEFVRGEKLIVTRNDAYWRGKPQWDRIHLKPISDDQARVAALMSGDVDMIEDVPTAALGRLKEDQKVEMVQAVTQRVIYLHMDQFRDTTPFITAKDGTAVANPLRDKRVRLALSKAINRDAIVARVMGGAAISAGQFLAPGFFGTSPALKPTAYDPEGAKKLLADAGLPLGFKLTLHSPAGRYTNDVKVAEALAQMFQRSGIDASVESLPPAQFFARASSGDKGKPEFSLILAGRSSGTGEVSDSVIALVHTVNPTTGAGAANRGRYSNPDVDTLIEAAQSAIDVPQRAELLMQASVLSISDTAIIPIYYPVQTWALRKGLAYKPRADEFTLGSEVISK